MSLIKVGLESVDLGHEVIDSTRLVKCTEQIYGVADE